MGVNDELLAGVSHYIIWDLTLGKSFFWNSQVHHDLCLSLREVAKVKFGNVKKRIATHHAKIIMGQKWNLNSPIVL